MGGAKGGITVPPDSRQNQKLFSWSNGATKTSGTCPVLQEFVLRNDRDDTKNLIGLQELETVSLIGLYELQILIGLYELQMIEKLIKGDTKIWEETTTPNLLRSRDMINVIKKS